ncbi:putative general substrate transporter [Klebsiella pneumoniae]|uniref:Putative general substrate transporter n=1 Tax=Klebsiella pneumoniae TaxID=573 RepID=A0A378FV52_KLEPN|nr:putative general substrate transporter [Klebsiella pneumoniae]
MIVDSWNGQMGWRWMFGAELVPALAFLVLMFFVPESPRWLMKAGKPERARAALERMVLPTMPTGSCVKSRIPWKRITIKSPMARCWLPR